MGRARVSFRGMGNREVFEEGWRDGPGVVEALRGIVGGGEDGGGRRRGDGAGVTGVKTRAGPNGWVDGVGKESGKHVRGHPIHPLAFAYAVRPTGFIGLEMAQVPVRLLRGGIWSGPTFYDTWQCVFVGYFLNHVDLKGRKKKI